MSKIVSLRQSPMMRLIDDYHSYLHLHDHPSGTIEQYVSYPRRFLTDTDLEVEEVELSDVAAWVSQFDWGHNTKRHALKCLRLFFDWVHDIDLIDHSPLEGMKPVKNAKSVPRPLPENVLQIRLAILEGEDHRLLAFAAETGLRRVELARTHSDWVEQHGDSWWLRVRGKGDKTRLVPISADSAQWLLRKRGYLFPSHRKPGRHRIASNVGKLYKRLLGGEWTTHSLRHRFATIAYARTQDIRAVQELLGHESLTTTQIYTTVANDRLRQVAEVASVGDWSDAA